jgi:hypothetical protein
MPTAQPGFGWPEAVVAFAIVAVAAFLVTWLATDRLRLTRAPYIGVLLFVTLGLCAAYLAWTGTSAVDLIVSNWVRGLVAGVLVAVASLPMVRRLPRRHGPTGSRLAWLLVWEAGVYGIAEAVLLATLPVLAIWQASTDLGWTVGVWAKAGSGALALAGALLVVLVHHLGYREFRTRAARPKLGGALVVCGLQAIAFLLTGNVLAPMVAHVLLHGQMLVRGVELPPVSVRRSHADIPVDLPAPSPGRFSTAGRT